MNSKILYRDFNNLDRPLHDLLVDNIYLFEKPTKFYYGRYIRMYEMSQNLLILCKVMYWVNVSLGLLCDFPL